MSLCTMSDTSGRFCRLLFAALVHQLLLEGSEQYPILATSMIFLVCLFDIFLCMDFCLPGSLRILTVADTDLGGKFYLLSLYPTTQARCHFLQSNISCPTPGLPWQPFCPSSISVCITGPSCVSHLGIAPWSISVPHIGLFSFSPVSFICALLGWCKKYSFSLGIPLEIQLHRSAFLWVTPRQMIIETPVLSYMARPPIFLCLFSFSTRPLLSDGSKSYCFVATVNICHPWLSHLPLTTMFLVCIHTWCPHVPLRSALFCEHIFLGS